MTTPLEHLAIAEKALMRDQSESTWTAIEHIRSVRAELIRQQAVAELERAYV